MTFTLIVNTGDYTDTYENPDFETIEDEIDDLLAVEYHNIILECDETVNGFRFIQTAIFLGGKDKDKYCVEIQHELGETKFKNGTPFTQYELRTSDIETVKQAFKMFVSGTSPDVSEWRNVSNDMIEEFKSRNRDKKIKMIVRKTKRFFNLIQKI
jgi:hypothetical protein